MSIPDFGMIRTDFQGITLEARAIAPGLTLHDLIVAFEEARRGASEADRYSANPTKWPDVRGINAVAQKLLEAVYADPWAPSQTTPDPPQPSPFPGS